MYRLGQCELVFINQSQDENYNPIVNTSSKLVKCQLMDSFSVNYYREQTRDMRKSKNIRVDKYQTNDRTIDNERYQLEYVDINSIRYKVMNILKDRNSELKVVLDCEEVINE